MSKEKRSSEKMLWAEHPGSVLWETGEGALLQERVLSGVLDTSTGSKGTEQFGAV